jgi:hypothetical protein
MLNLFRGSASAAEPISKTLLCRKFNDVSPRRPFLRARVSACYVSSTQYVLGLNDYDGSFISPRFVVMSFPEEELDPAFVLGAAAGAADGLMTMEKVRQLTTCIAAGTDRG